MIDLFLPFVCLYIKTALKSLSGKAEEMIEKTKTSVGEMAAEKKAAAAAMLEGQAKKTGDLLWQTKTNAETGVSEIVTEGKAAAIDGFDKEVASAEKLVEEGLNEVLYPGVFQWLDILLSKYRGVSGVQILIWHVCVTIPLLD